MTGNQFRNIVWKHYEEAGRHTLPWRLSPTPYRVLVSEMMLQQTQVERVIPYFAAWMKEYPSVAKLAHASLSDVLRRWQGLGYNRRAKALHDAAKSIVRAHGGRVPKDVAALRGLPGVGPYTANAIRAFAFNEDALVIETNIRTAIIHHFFTNEEAVSDEQIEAVLAKISPLGDARRWYSALMDYGAHLKRSGARLNGKTRGYAKQASFTGSNRQTRGALVRALSNGSSGKASLLELFPEQRKRQAEEQLRALIGEGLVVRRGRTYTLPD